MKNRKTARAVSSDVGPDPYVSLRRRSHDFVRGASNCESVPHVGGSLLGPRTVYDHSIGGCEVNVLPNEELQVLRTRPLQHSERFLFATVASCLLTTSWCPPSSQEEVLVGSRSVS